MVDQLVSGGPSAWVERRFTHVVKAFSTVTTEPPPEDDRITSEDQIKDPLDARAAYAAIAARAQGHNQLQWQTPSLALTAEAFLLQIALGHESTAPARLVASALNLVLSLLCIQLMAKHREMQIDDRQILIRLETRLGLPTYHEKPRVDDLSPWKRHLRTSSTTLWMIGFGILAAVALGILIFTAGRLLWDFLDLCDSTL